MSQFAKDHILRIGVIREGKIIEEKLVRKRTPVTVGKEASNTIVLPSPAVPDAFTLFDLRGNDYFLVFDDQMTGRLSVGEEAAADLKAIKTQPGVIRSGSLYQLMLNPASKGRVVIGDFVILFQFVKPPPEPSRPQLPQSVRGYWTRNIDWPYATSFGFTMTFMVVLWIWSANVPIVKKEMTMEDIPDRFAKMIMPDKEMSKPKEEGPGPGAGEGQQQQQNKKKKNQAKEQQAGAEGPADAQARAAAQRVAMEKKVAGRGLLKVLGARGDGVAIGGAVADVFSEGRGGGAGGDEFAGIGGLDVAASAGAAGSRGFEGATQAASLQDLGTRGVVGGAGQGGTQKQEARVVARVTSAALEEFDSDSRDQQEIVKTIQRRIGGVQHCYERKLKRNPDLKGKIVIRFTIHPGGKVIDAKVVENTTGDPELGECIAAQIKAIRFPQTEGGETVVTYPFILAPGS
jgi:hypothetical protein